MTVWFEYRKPSNPTGWGFVPKTPERQVSSNANLSAHVEWLYGLEPDTTYEFRLCGRLDDGTTACDTTAPAFSFTTQPSSGLAFVEIDPNDPKRLALEDGAPFVPWGNNYVKVQEAGPNALVGEVMYDAQGLAMIRRDFEQALEQRPSRRRAEHRAHAPRVQGFPARREQPESRSARAVREGSSRSPRMKACG